jgi:integrase
MSELNKIINLDLSENEILDRIRDVFLFTVFAGFRYGDAQRLTMDNIIVTDGKYETIYLNSQQKNSIPVSIPVLPKVDEIIRKYEYSSERLILNRILPKFTNAYFNRRIKEIAKLCKIEMNLHHHVGRHTFASTILTENGVSIYEVQKWMGHSSINSTKVYSHVTPSRMKKTAEMLAKAL